MRRLDVAALLAVLACVVSTACTGGSGSTTTSPSTTSSTTVVDAMSGSWKSSALTTGSTGPCSGVNYTVTPTGSGTAAINYSATCGSTAVSGSGTATANGSSLSWTTEGGLTSQTFGPLPCSFKLSGTTTPTGASTAAITYTGTVCGVPVSGSDVLTR
jgi:hypothetical protein